MESQTSEMVSGFTARYATLKPRKGHIALPLLIMAALYATSSLPGTSTPDEPGVNLILLIGPLVQNGLHLPVYALLSWSLHWALLAWGYSSRRAAIGACAIALAFGTLDEWHQSFVPGRLASLTDIVLNAAGAALGVWLGLRLERWRQEFLQKP